MTQAELVSSDGTYKITGLTVGTADAQVIVTDTNPGIGISVGLTSFTLTEAADFNGV